jgi:hypothetical protein
MNTDGLRHGSYQDLHRESDGECQNVAELLKDADRLILTAKLVRFLNADSTNIPRAGFRLDEALSYLRHGALYKSRYSMSVTNMIFGYLEG